MLRDRRAPWQKSLLALRVGPVCSLKAQARTEGDKVIFEPQIATGDALRVLGAYCSLKQLDFVIEGTFSIKISPKCSNDTL
jgi:hypothetical protein